MKSVIIPSLITLVLFVLAGWWSIVSLRNFYYQQRVDEALLTAKSYAISFGLLIDSDQRFSGSPFSALDICSKQPELWPEQMSNEFLAKLADESEMDIIYFYDDTLTVTHSSDGSFIGWQVPLEHPVRSFYESDKQTLVEVIRFITGTSAPYKFGFFRCPDGRIIQGGMHAQSYVSQYGRIKPQRIIEELAQHSNTMRIGILDTEQSLIASSDPEKVGAHIDYDQYNLPISEQKFHLVRYEKEPYLAVHMPLEIKDASIGSVIVLFSLVKMNWLIHRVSIIITLILLLFFIFFLLAFSRTQRLNQKVFHLATHDPLTGLPNLRKYISFEHDLKRQPHALMVTNLVNFRRLNMLYGYAHGDEKLVAFSSFLKRLVDEYEGVQTFRLSNDRFVLLVTKHANHWHLNSLATELINRSVAEGLCAHQGISIGIAQHPGGGRLKQGTLLKKALIALGATTFANTVQFYNASLEGKLLQNNHIESLINRIIREEEELLSVYYQPIYDRKHQTISSFEALARIECPELGTIPPDEFIPIAEREHLIVPFGKLILRAALELVERQNLLGIYFCDVTVNISALQLMDDSFAAFVQEELTQRHIHPSRLIFELTESTFAADQHLLVQRMAELRAMGIRFAIDDFGTGYSSLSRLKELQFDTLKIGRSFTREVKSEEDMHFIRTVIALAHQMGKTVVAEGVETIVQYELLIEAKCDYLQGYLFDRPLELVDALERCKKPVVLE